MEASSQRWQASEELSALLVVCFTKELTGFYKRQIIPECLRPDVDRVYTPALDRFLPDFVHKCKFDDKVFRIMQDLLLDVTGSISMSYEMVLQPKENGRQLDHSSILSCLTKSMQLLGNVNEHISSKRRTQVLTKNGQKYTSLSNEIWENNGREHFGPQFEH